MPRTPSYIKDAQKKAKEEMKKRAMSLDPPKGSGKGGGGSKGSVPRPSSGGGGKGGKGGEGGKKAKKPKKFITKRVDSVEELLSKTLDTKKKRSSDEVAIDSKENTIREVGTHKFKKRKKG